MFDNLFNSPRSRFRAALLLAVVADILQVVAFPLFVEGAAAPVDDVLDIVVALALICLLGWHWEFTPSLIAELIPGVDLVPFWTFAVANVYRKWKRIHDAADQTPSPRMSLEGSIDVEPPKGSRQAQKIR